MRGAVHRPVLLEEALAALNIQADGIYVDGTFGRGGHSRGILQRLGPQGRLLALDRDPAAVAVARAWNDARLSAFHSRFGRLAEILEAAGFRQVEGILLDLGVSSPQLEEGERGFSFRLDGPLDMRMDPTSGESAREWLAHASEIRIGEVLKTYGEERFAKQIARAIVRLERQAVLALPKNSPRWSPQPSPRGSQARTRRRAPFRLYGFSSTRSLRSCR